LELFSPDIALLIQMLKSFKGSKGSAFTSPELTSLIPVLKPFLGAKGNAFSDRMAKVLELAASEQGKDLLRTLFPASRTRDNGKPITINSPSGLVPFKLNSTLTVFLVLVLLVLSGKH